MWQEKKTPTLAFLAESKTNVVQVRLTKSVAVQMDNVLSSRLSREDPSSLTFPSCYRNNTVTAGLQQ